MAKRMNKLIGLIARYDFKQKEIAQKLKVDEATISNALTGKAPMKNTMLNSILKIINEAAREKGDEAVSINDVWED